jgi:hypothetical protein
MSNPFQQLQRMVETDELKVRFYILCLTGRFVVCVSDVVLFSVSHYYEFFTFRLYCNWRMYMHFRVST